MRKLILAALTATMLVPVAASAQTGELRRDRQEVQRDRAEVRQDMRRGDRQEAREDRQELREDQRELREDWQQYRRSHQSQYRQGRYTAPRGYAYRSVRVGSSLNPAFYNNRYWINDPYSYRLPRMSQGTRYVRYGNDALLINVRTGRVLRVYSGFFY
jgi:Ni/Co efflux regulator RcnB